MHHEMLTQRTFFAITRNTKRYAESDLCKSWTLDWTGPDRGLDHGLNCGLQYGLILDSFTEL